jgi:hypothetical protein
MLGAVYDAFRDRGSTLAPLLDRIGARPAVYVGSGGAVPVARFAADIHVARTGTLAQATTPLMLAGAPPLRDAAAVILSAHAAHPDVALALKAARRALLEPRVLVTHRDISELSHLAGLATDVLTLVLPGHREGFLATRSVLAMATVFAASLGWPLPSRLPSLERDPRAIAMRSRTLVLHGPHGAPVAADLETRLSEIGLSSVQTVDYRNFAHGRHYGFFRHIEDTLVVAIIDAEDVRLAEAILAIVPQDTLITRLETPLSWPASTLDLLVRSMQLVGSLALGRDEDPSRPNVPSFGRRLYHLAVGRQIETRAIGPIDRKVLALGRPASAPVRLAYQTAFDLWFSEIAAMRFNAVVLDYDGTICRTDGRFELPSARVRGELERLLEAGVLVGIASGRGPSLQRDLRAWVPKQYWDQVEIGLYSGSVLARLGEAIEVPSKTAPELAEFVERLGADLLGREVATEVRPTQVSMATRDHHADPLTVTGIAEVVIDRADALPLRIVRSAHSIDVVPLWVSKRAVIDRVAARSGGPVLAIGDQGQPGGNDYALLAAVCQSLSVDRCSADPTRCWNLLRPGEAGPDGLVRYLRALRWGPRGFRFRWAAHA